MKRKLSFFSLSWKGTVDLLCHYLKTSPTLDRGTLRMRFVLGWKSPPPPSPCTHTWAVSWAAIWHILQHIELPVPLASDALPCSSAATKMHPKNKREKCSLHNTHSLLRSSKQKQLTFWCNTIIIQQYNNFERTKLLSQEQFGLCNEKITISVISILLIFSGLLVSTCCLYLYHIVAYGVPILFLYNNYNNIHFIAIIIQI